MAAVPTEVGLGPIGIAVAVGLVVLVVVADQIVQVEAVVAVDEIHGLVRAAGGEQRGNESRLGQGFASGEGHTAAGLLEED